MSSDKKKKYIGIEIGGTKLQIVIGDANGKIHQSLRFTVDVENGAAGIREQICQALSQISLDEIASIGVGFGGPVDWKTGEIQVSHQIEGWSHFNLKTWLAGITGKPVTIDNDANVAALAEAVCGGGKDYQHVFYMTVGSGIGGGMIINKSIYHGKIPGEVEIGHIRLNKDGETLESKCSGWAVNKRVSDFIRRNPKTKLAKLAIGHSGPEALLLQPAIKGNDSYALQMLDEITDDIAFALSHVVHLFHPDVVIIGGGLSMIGDVFTTSIENKLPNYIMKAFLPAPSILPAYLGENVVPIGALQLAQKPID